MKNKPNTPKFKPHTKTKSINNAAKIEMKRKMNEIIKAKLAKRVSKISGEISKEKLYSIKKHIKKQLISRNIQKKLLKEIPSDGLTLERKIKINSWFSSDPLLTLRDAENRCLRLFRLIITKKDLLSCLELFIQNLTFKIPIEILNTPELIKERIEFAKTFKILYSYAKGENLIFLDYVELSLNMVNKKIILKNKDSNKTETSSNESIFVAVSCNKNGIIQLLIGTEDFDGIKFGKFINESRKKAVKDGVTEPVFVYNETKFEKFPWISKKLSQTGATPFYLPSSSDCINLSHQVIVKFMETLNSKQYDNKDEVIASLSPTFRSLEESDFKDLFKLIRKKIKSCKKGKPLEA
ncbi:hypothetical protein AYI70_g3437 [Smittium culicis]|uniref:Uncharacterized protein n=1 Tax=Smittium culicis TaxID=133412 RepID=A0A1R1Y3H3_9FUNG|nr:hypothetical protein AYI70_g3437 [Smittium culicis]